jgi:hypothetical protein
MPLKVRLDFSLFPCCVLFKAGFSAGFYFKNYLKECIQQCNIQDCQRHSLQLSKLTYGAFINDITAKDCEVAGAILIFH